MDCPKCGYALFPFDKECPRCADLAKTQRDRQPTQQMPPPSAGTSTGRSHQMKRCPQCANRLVQTAQHCPGCNYHYPDPTTGIQQAAFCSSCGQTAEYGIRFCKNCGASQQPLAQHPVPSQALQPPMYFPRSPGYDMAPPAKTGLISAMWVLTVLQIGVRIATAGTGFALEFLLDIPAFIIAIILVCSKNGTDKGNGWAKLSLEAIGFMLSFAASASAPRY